MDICLIWVLRVVRWRSLQRGAHSFRGGLPTVVRLCTWSRNLVNEEDLAHWGLSCQKQKKVTYLYIYKHIQTYIPTTCLPTSSTTCVQTYMYIYPLTYLPNLITSPWCRVLLEKLTGLQLVKKFLAFHGTRRFITALTSVRHLSLSCASPIQSIYPHLTSWRTILILSTHLSLGLPSGLPNLLYYSASLR